MLYSIHMSVIKALFYKVIFLLKTYMSVIIWIKDITFLLELTNKRHSYTHNPHVYTQICLKIRGF